MLLEIDNEPVIEQKLQNTTSLFRSYFKDKNIRIRNLNLENQTIKFSVEENLKQQIIDIFNDENSEITHTIQDLSLISLIY